MLNLKDNWHGLRCGTMNLDNKGERH